MRKFRHSVGKFILGSWALVNIYAGSATARVSVSKELVQIAKALPEVSSRLPILQTSISPQEILSLYKELPNTPEVRQDWVVDTMTLAFVDQYAHTLSLESRIRLLSSVNHQLALSFGKRLNVLTPALLKKGPAQNERSTLSAFHDPIEIYRLLDTARDHDQGLAIIAHHVALLIKTLRPHTEFTSMHFMKWAKGSAKTLPQEEFKKAALLVNKLKEMAAKNGLYQFDRSRESDPLHFSSERFEIEPRLLDYMSAAGLRDNLVRLETLFTRKPRL